VIEEIIKFLEDGNWHTLREIKESFNLSEINLWKIIRFLEIFGFAEVDEEERKARLDSSFLQLPA